jgi:hypothetical protein
MNNPNETGKAQQKNTNKRREKTKINCKVVDKFNPINNCTKLSRLNHLIKKQRLSNWMKK